MRCRQKLSYRESFHDNVALVLGVVASTQSLSGTAVEFHECCLATGATAGALILMIPLCSFLEVLHGSWEMPLSLYSDGQSLRTRLEK